jgi:hypothetical protein
MLAFQLALERLAVAAFNRLSFLASIAVIVSCEVLATLILPITPLAAVKIICRPVGPGLEQVGWLNVWPDVEKAKEALATPTSSPV